MGQPPGAVHRQEGDLDPHGEETRAKSLAGGCCPRFRIYTYFCICICICIFAFAYVFVFVFVCVVCFFLLLFSIFVYLFCSFFVHFVSFLHFFVHVSISSFLCFLLLGHARDTYRVFIFLSMFHFARCSLRVGLFQCYAHENTSLEMFSSVALHLPFFCDYIY